MRQLSSFRPAETWIHKTIPLHVVILLFFLLAIRVGEVSIHDVDVTNPSELGFQSRLQILDHSTCALEDDFASGVTKSRDRGEDFIDLCRLTRHLALLRFQRWGTIELDDLFSLVLNRWGVLAGSDIRLPASLPL